MREDFDDYNLEGDISNDNTSNDNTSRDNNLVQDNLDELNNQQSGRIIQEQSKYNFWIEKINEETKTEKSDKGHKYSEEIVNKESINDESFEKAVSYIKDIDKEQNYDSNFNIKKKSKLGIKIAKVIGTAAVFGVIAGASFQGFNYVYYKANPNAQKAVLNSSSHLSIDGINNTGLIEKTTVSTNLIKQSTDVSDVVEETMPSIVSIKSTVKQQYQDWFGNAYDKDSEGSGSGIIIGKNDTELLIATNNHVVTGASEIKVTFIDETELTAEIKGTDSIADLAVVAIKLDDIKQETSDKIKIAALGDSEDVRVGQMAIAIGNALGYGQSVTVGYISAKDRTVNISNEQTMVLLQTDAAINPGNSGGALLNIKGEVIGINSVKYASSDVEGMGYAIPISKATPIINDLMKREIIKEEEQGYLGIAGNDVTADDSSRYNMPIGIYVNAVGEDSAANKAGVLTRDIITKVNGIEVTTIASLKEIVNSYKVGTVVSLTIMRGDGGSYKEQNIDVTLGKKPVELETNPNEATIEQQEDNMEENQGQSDYFNNDIDMFEKFFGN